jgi:site-specific DNA recombinase
VDRLSRSLLDFSKIMATFDSYHVSFVSVTQQFSTTSSMGRLTLNILLSFAQFEREIISERTRDKMHAAKKRGQWLGGWPILGYDIVRGGGRVELNKVEAGKVHEIFELYLQLGGLLPVVKEINRRGWINKEWITRKGKRRGGQPFDRFTLYRLLTNIAYVGKVRYKKELYPGQQPAIVNEHLFQKVQDTLREHGRSGNPRTRNKYGALLRGLIYCAPCNTPMVHTYTTKGAKRYRYYVCQSAMKRGWDSCPTKSIPAAEVEQFVVDRIKSMCRDNDLVLKTLDEVRQQGRKGLEQLEQEQLRLQREMEGYGYEIRGLAEGLGANSDEESPASARLADLQERLRRVEERTAAVRSEMDALREQDVDDKQVTDALQRFDPIWTSLSTMEQARVLNLLVEQVRYDGSQGKLAIAFRPNGIKALGDEMAVQTQEQTA